MATSEDPPGPKATGAGLGGRPETGDPMVDNPLLRSLGYAGRVGRLVATYLSRGSRYLAYTSDVGEAFRPVVNANIVRASYAVSWTYVLGDVALTTKRALDAGHDYVRAGVHAAVFQSLGSMLAPAIVIHTTVHQTEKLLHRLGRSAKFGPTAAGLAVVPFLPFFVDPPVEYAVDKAFEVLWPSKDPTPHGHHHHHPQQQPPAPHNESKKDS